VVKIAIVIGVVQGMVAYSVRRRKISAWIQDRVGPNRTAPPFSRTFRHRAVLIRLGIFQPLADGLSSCSRKELTPAGRAKDLFLLAPASR